MSSSTQTEYTLPLTGKVAVVTGASRGIGAGVALELARRGAATARLILGYTSPGSEADIQAIAAQIQSLPHRPAAHPCRADLGTTDGAEVFVADLLAWWKAKGNEEENNASTTSPAPLHIDILVNNAGVDIVRPLADITAADFDSVYSVNVRGVALLTQALLPHFNPKSPKRIINIGSGRSARAPASKP